MDRRSLLKLLGVSAIAAVAPPRCWAEALGPIDPSPIAAIPGASGFGARAWGGTSPFGLPSHVAFITSLDDYGADETPRPGTLRFEVSQSGPRVICLARAGTIRLKRDLVIEQPFLTLTGLLAPAPGTVIAGARVVVKTHDVVLTDLRIRPGDYSGGTPPSERDCIALWGRRDGRWGERDSVERVLIHRCSLSFSTDELFSTYQYVRDLTVQSCLLSHALRYTEHKDIDDDEGPGPKNHHSMGILINPQVSRFSLVGNVTAHVLHRLPRIALGASGEVLNNLFYGFGAAKGDRLYAEGEVRFPNERHVRVVGNVWIPRPGTEVSGPLYNFGKAAREEPGNVRFHVHDNLLLGQGGEPVSGVDVAIPPALRAARDGGEFPADRYVPLPARKLEQQILQEVGARDSSGGLELYDRTVLDTVSKRGGAPADTIRRDRKELNGFPVSALDYDYPEPGLIAKLSPPADTRRVRPAERSPVEQWLWKQLDD